MQRTHLSHVVFWTVVLAALFAHFCHASPVGNPDPRDDAEEWMDSLKQLYEEQPELRTERGSGWMPYSRLRWWVDRRRSSDGSLPEFDARRRAWDVKRAREASMPRGEGPSWFQLGPTNHSGRMIDIEFHPLDSNIVYAGSAGGGLWKSTDGGDSWIPLTDELLNMAIGGVALVPSDPDIVLIGTGDGVNASGGQFGQGIFRSTDAGATWTPTSLSFPETNQAGFHVMAVHPELDVILAGSNRGLFRSTDAGENWAQVSAGNWTDIQWKPGDAGVIYGARKSSGVNVSTDGGVTWSIAGVGQPTASLIDKTKIGVTAADPEMIYANFSRNSPPNTLAICRSTDGGATWEIRNDTLNMAGSQGWYNVTLVADPDDSEHLIAGGISLYNSTNGGTTWNRIDNGNPLGDATNPHLDNHVAAYEPGSTSDVWVGNDGGIWKSTNDGSTWTWRGEGLVTYQFYDICVAQSDPLFMMGGTQDNGIPGRDGADTWFQSSLVADGMVCCIPTDNPDRIYSEWQFGNHVRSLNGGLNWGNMQGGLTGSGLLVAPMDLDYHDANHLYTATTAGVFRSTNGFNWQLASPPGNSAVWISMSPIDGDVVWTGSLSLVRHTTDDGGTWVQAAPYGFIHGPFLKIYAHPLDIETAFVTFGGYSDRSHVGMTTDFGVSWTDVTGDLPDMPVTGMVIDPESASTWFIGTDLGVWWSTDGGDHWEPYASGMPNVEVTDLEIHRSTRKLVAGTYGRGAWEVALPNEPAGLNESSPGASVHLMLDPPIENPSDRETKFRFAAHSDGPVQLEVHDLSGRRIAEIVSLTRGDGIVRVVRWETESVASGVYFAVLRAGGEYTTRRIVVAH